MTKNKQPNEKIPEYRELDAVETKRRVEELQRQHKIRKQHEKKWDWLSN
jgi:hypothetical protein